VSTERFLVTGALGCIGAWSCAQLVREGVPVVAHDLGEDTRRLESIMSLEELARLTFVKGDILDLVQLEQVIVDHGVTHLIHLAAMLLPLVKADPPRGAAVNVVGTTNVMEAAKRRRLRGFAYASSGAVLAPGVRVATGRVPRGAAARLFSLAARHDGPNTASTRQLNRVSYPTGAGGRS
jgi:UDP-glucuronate 4-epimerase